MSQLHDLLEKHRREQGLSPTEVSRAIGRSPSYFRKMLETKSIPGGETLMRLARVLNVDIDVLNAAVSGQEDAVDTIKPTPNAGPADVTLPYRSDMPRDVPVFGTAAGSAMGAKNGAWQLSGDPIDYAGRMPGLVSARDAYGLYVENSSMEPRYPHGELVFVHPGKPVRPGDPVIVQTQSHEHAPPETYIKILVRRTAGEVICEQYNPKAEIRFKADTIKALHRVLSVAEIAGV